jgi:hypothetical protein
MPTRRGLLCVVAGIVTLVGATSARAASPSEHLASPGSSIVSADQLISLVSYTSSTTTYSGSKTTNSATSIAFFTANAGSTASVLSFKTLPRLAFDYVLGTGITIGGAAWFFTNVSVSQSSGGMSTDQPKATYWGVAPRLGFVLPLGDILAIWPRTGVDYGEISFGSGGSVTVNGNAVNIGGSSINQLAVDLDALLVVTPVRHLGLTIGPSVGIPLSGKVNTNVATAPGATASADISMWYVAVNLGLMGYF